MNTIMWSRETVKGRVGSFLCACFKTSVASCAMSLRVYVCSLSVCVCVYLNPVFHLPLSVIISRQQRRVQLMRIRQKEERRDRSRKRKNKQQRDSTHSSHPPKPLHPEPAYRRKPNPIRRFDGDVLSPVSVQVYSLSLSLIVFRFLCPFSSSLLTQCLHQHSSKNVVSFPLSCRLSLTL